MRIVFLLPEIQGRLTGGNLYNLEAVRELSREFEVRRCTVSPGASKRDFSLPVCGQTVFMVDSLVYLNGHPEFVHELGKQGKVCLLAHFLPFGKPMTDLYNFDGFVVPSQFMRLQLIQSKIPAKKICVAKPGLRPEFLHTPLPEPSGRFPPQDSDKSPVHLFTVANLVEGKGLVEVTAGMKQWSGFDWSWKIAGELDMDSPYRTRFDEVSAGIEKSITLLGPLSEKALVSLYDECDLYVSPSSFESFGISIQEALSRYRMPIAFNVGGIPEQFPSSLRANLLPEGRYDLFMKMLESLCRNRKMRTQFNRLSRQCDPYRTWRESLGPIGRFLANIGEVDRRKVSGKTQHFELGQVDFGD